MSSINQRIVCAANRYEPTGRIILGARHWDDFMRAQVNGEGYGGKWEQGFIDNRRMFLTREEAWIIAEREGQIVRRCGGDGVQLFSENLY